VDRQGLPKRVPGNAVLFLSRHPDWKDVLGYNEMRQRVVWLKTPPGDFGIAKPSVGEQLTDWHATHTQHWLDKNYGLSFSHEILLRSIVSAAQSNPFHPIREYLGSLEWDNTPRIERWLSTYMGAEDTDYNNLIGRCWLISAVARVMVPGAKVDHVLVLESPQGRGKSMGMATLFGHGDDWYMESLPELSANGSKDAMAALAGPWCIEIAELDAIKGKASTKTKDFLSRRVDEYRPSYGRCYVRYPRQCVFVGTTNQHAWLSDPTGGRRFWPCKVDNIDRGAIRDDRDQIWAEAYAHFVEGAQWWPPEEFTAILMGEQEARYDVDAWEDLISQFCKDRKEIDVNDIYQIALGIDKGKITRADQTRAGSVMVRLGFRKMRPYVGGVRKTVYRRH
jgi:putative DNA primase/helicase